MSNMTKSPYTGATKTPAPRRHLMVPGQPRPRQRGGAMSVTAVQRWVISTLALLTIEHLAGGLVLAAIFADPHRPGARLGLLIIAGAFGTIAVLVALVVHHHRLISAWLLLGPLPTLVGAYFCFWR